MSGFSTASDGDFDRVFMTTTDLIDQFVGEQLWTWGKNAFGVLMNNSTIPSSSPSTTAGGGNNWKQIVIKESNSAAIKTDGTLWVCGYDTYGWLGDNSYVDKLSPVTIAGGGTNWKQVSLGFGSGNAIKTDGTLWGWGYNSNGQVGDGTTMLRTSPVTIAGGGTNWKQVACGNDHTAAIKTNGTLWTWGYNAYGQLGDNTAVRKSSPVTAAGGGTNWKQVACGLNHTAAIKTDGTLWTWGRNNYGQLGDNTSVSKSSPVTTAGGGTNWKQVACGGYHTAAIKTDGTLWTCGYNAYGGLGDNTVVSKSSPVTAAGGGTNWKQVSGGFSHTAAIKTDGTLWTWGRDNYGQLGDNTAVNKSSPSMVITGITWNKVFCGLYSTAGIGY